LSKSCENGDSVPLRVLPNDFMLVDDSDQNAKKFGNSGRYGMSFSGTSVVSFFIVYIVLSVFVLKG